MTISGGDGSSFEKAIVVHAASLPQATLAGFEYIALRYNWFQITSGSLVRHNGKSYKVLTYEDHRAMGDPKQKRVFYLDVSEYVPTYSSPPEYPREARENGLMGKGERSLELIQLLVAWRRYRWSKARGTRFSTTQLYAPSGNGVTGLEA